jgi:hypothetical protein
MVVDPPKDTDEPLIVIAEFANLAFVTEPSGKVTVEFDVSKVTPVGTVTVSPDSPRFILVPDCGTHYIITNCYCLCSCYANWSCQYT